MLLRSDVMRVILAHIHGNIAALAHGDAHIGLGQCMTIVDTIAHHGYNLSAFLQLLYECGFIRQ